MNAMQQGQGSSLQLKDVAYIAGEATLGAMSFTLGSAETFPILAVICAGLGGYAGYLGVEREKNKSAPTSHEVLIRLYNRASFATVGIKAALHFSGTGITMQQVEKLPKDHPLMALLGLAAISGFAASAISSYKVMDEALKTSANAQKPQ